MNRLNNEFDSALWNINDAECPDNVEANFDINTEEKIENVVKNRLKRELFPEDGPDADNGDYKVKKQKLNTKNENIEIDSASLEKGFKDALKQFLENYADHSLEFDGMIDSFISDNAQNNDDEFREDTKNRIKANTHKRLREALESSSPCFGEKKEAYDEIFYFIPDSSTIVLAGRPARIHAPENLNPRELARIAFIIKYVTANDAIEISDPGRFLICPRKFSEPHVPLLSERMRSKRDDCLYFHNFGTYDIQVV